MQAELLEFGLIEIEGRRYDHDVVIDRGVVRRRRKGPSKAHRDRYGHTPLTVAEEIPWRGDELIVGTGASGQLPVMPEVIAEAHRRDILVVAVPTQEACLLLADREPVEVQAILHVTC